MYGDFTKIVSTKFKVISCLSSLAEYFAKKNISLRSSSIILTALLVISYASSNSAKI